MRTVLGGLKLLKRGNFLLKMIPVLESLKPQLPRLTSLCNDCGRTGLSVKDIASCTDISEGSVQTILKKAFGPEKGLR